MRQLSGQLKFASPSSGIYYAVPKDKSFDTWKIIFQRSDEVEEPYHYDLWNDYVINYLKEEFNLDQSEVNKLAGKDSGLPRGRVQSPKESGGYEVGWVIYHGNDAPDIIKHQVLSAFGLHEIRRANKLKWEVSEEEKMNENEQKIVEGILK